MAYPFKKGYRKRPSDAARWTRCAKALAFTKDYPNTSTGAADEGTAAHWIREQCLDLGFDAYDWIGTTVRVNGVGYECDPDMADALQPGIDEIREFPGKMFVETWVDTTEWVGPDEDGKPQGGTVDCGVVGTDLIVISDLKFGRGEPVQAAGNDQQMLYALAFYHAVAKHISSATTFLIIIDQPRNGAGGGYWTVTLADLEKYGAFIKARSEAADDPDAEFTPGVKQCKWCPAANVPGRPGGCPAHNQDMMDDVGITFDDLDAEDEWEPPIVEGMTPERMIAISLKRKRIEQWLEYCHAAAIQHLTDEGPCAGQKAVYGRAGNRKWASEDAAQAFMLQTLDSRDPFNKKLKSPAQVEKEKGKKFKVPAALVEQSDPKPIMVPEEDDREAIMPFNDEFDDYGSEIDLDEL